MDETSVADLRAEDEARGWCVAQQRRPLARVTHGKMAEEDGARAGVTALTDQEVYESRQR